MKNFTRFFIALKVTNFKVITIFSIFFFLFSAGYNTIQAQTIDVPTGSVIIDMGVMPQTIDNGLKPYGLVYSLIKDFATPVIWSIEPTKAKDGIDFTVDGIDFRGGTFIISEEYLSTAVLAEIEDWSNGTTGMPVDNVDASVITYTTLSPVTVPLKKELKFFANWVIDSSAERQSIAILYLTNAGIPATSYTLGTPSSLGACEDLFILPHADPSWADHGNLSLWNNSIANGGSAGYIWSGCHAVSALENLFNPANTSEQLNFLSEKTTNTTTYTNTKASLPSGDFGVYYQNSLVLWKNPPGPTGHAVASGVTPYQNANPGDTFMQYIGNTDGAHAGGSERIYLPVIDAGGGWRPTTKISAWDANQTDLGTLTNGKAAIIAYGYAFGDTDRGQVMYEGGHQLDNGTAAENVAAQRVFLNFSFDAPAGKVPTIVENAPPATLLIENGDSVSFDITGTPTIGGGIAYNWSSSCSIGSFDDNTSATPTFTLPASPGITTPEMCTITGQAIDDCGRIAFVSYGFTLIPPPAPPIANDDNYTLFGSPSITFDALANDTDINENIDPTTFTPTSPLVVTGGTFVDNGNGNITFNADSGFVGTATLSYQICDDTPPIDLGPFCDTALITVEVSNDACGLGFVELIVPETGTHYVTESIVCIRDDNASDNTTCANTLGAPDNTSTGDFKRVNDEMELRMQGNSDAGATVIVDFAKFENPLSVNIAVSADGVSYTSVVDITDTDLDASLDYTFSAPVNFEYIKISHDGDDNKKFQLDAVTSNYSNLVVSCFLDTDNDGRANINDLDDDNDGILDTVELAGFDPDGDADTDGTPDYLDPDFAGFVDVNGDGVDDRFDTDDDGIIDSFDVDSDNDGCFDALEGGDNILASAVDTNGALTGMVDANGVPNNVNATTGQTVGTSIDNSTFDSFGQCDSDGDGVIDANDICNGFDDNADADEDTVPDGCDLDDDNDGILDTDECVDPGDTGSGINGSIIPTAWDIDSPSGSSGPVIFNSFTFNGEVITEYQVPIEYDESFAPTSPPLGTSDITRRTYGVEDLDYTTAADWNNEILPVFQSNDMNLYQDLQVDLINDVSYYELRFSPPVVSKDLIYALVFEKSGNNEVSIQALDALKNSLGTPIDVNVSDYVDTGSDIIANGVENLEIATYPIDNLAPVGSEIHWIRVYDTYTGPDAADGKVFIMAAPDIEFNCVDTDGDLIPDYLDTDSDNDGCPDAIEGAGTFVAGDLTTSDNLADADEGQVDANGVPEDISAASQQQATTTAVTNDLDATACVAPEADLSLTKTIDNATPSVGQTVIFSITISNAGPSDATGVQVRDMLPSGMTYDVASSTIPASTTYNVVSGIWDLSGVTIVNGTSYTLEIAAVISPACGNITNVAEIISSDLLDPDSTIDNGN